MHGPVLNDVWVSAHARNHVICLRCPKCPVAVVFVDVDLPYWTSKVEHIAAFTAIFSNICTAHAQKRLFINFRCKFRHRRSIRILYSECPPYFYFRFVWPADLESIPHAPTRTLIISTKFEVDMTIHCRVTAFLSADTSRDLVTLTFDLCSCRTWRVTWKTLPQSLNTLRLFIHELRVITVPIDYRWQCAESREPWLWGEKRLHFSNPDPDLLFHYTTLVALQWR